MKCERELFRFICLFIRRPVMEHTEKEDAVLDFFRFHPMEKMATEGWENPAQDMTIGRVIPTNSAKPIVCLGLFKNVMTKETSEHKILCRKN